jgi:hypothetical protein
VSDVRHGLRSASGAIEGEFSINTYDDFLAAALRRDPATAWVAGTSLSNTQLTSVTSDNGAGTFIFAGGDPVSLGLRIGDVIRFTGLAATANNSVNFRITAFGGVTNRTVTVTPKPATDAVADSSFTVAVQGNKLTMGTATPSFTIEQRMPDLDISERFDGCRIGGARIQIPPGGMATIGFDIQGKDGTILTSASSPYFTSITAAPVTAVLAGPNGKIRIGGVEAANIISLDMALTNGLSPQPVIGSNLTPEVFYGRSIVTGSVSVLLDSEALINAFLNESEIDIVTVLESGSVAPLDFYTLNMQRVKFTGVQKTVGVDGGVIANFPYQSLLKAAGSGFDATSLTLQRSL